LLFVLDVSSVDALLPWPERILMTADSTDGMWSYTLELSRVLSSFGIHVTLATMGAPRSAMQRRESEGIERLDIIEQPFNVDWRPDDDGNEQAAAAQWLREIDTAIVPSLVHVNHVCHAAIGWSAPTLVAAHSCPLSRWLAVHGTRAPADWTRYRHEVDAALRSASVIVATSIASKQAWEQYYTPVRRARVIPSGRDGRWVIPDDKDSVIVSMGELGDEAANLRALADVAGILPWPIELLGAIETHGVRHALSRASIFAWPAKYAPFATPVLDAALCGCALVLGDIPSLRETWKDAALFVAPEDRAELAAALCELTDSPARRHQLGHAARARALECSASRMATGYLSVYCGLMAQRCATAATASLSFR
jgi:glycosyltransferase involved in cell wall biosynthesis